MRADYRLVDRLSQRCCERMRAGVALRVHARRDRVHRDVRSRLGLGEDERPHQPALLVEPAGRRGLHHAGLGRRHVRVRRTAGDYFGPKYGDLLDTPLMLRDRGGRLVAADCDRSDLEREFWDYCHTDENSDRVGELAFGTNLGLERMIGVLLQDEKVPGVHIAFGDPYGSQTGADWKSTHARGRADARLRRLDRRRAGHREAGYRWHGR